MHGASNDKTLFVIPDIGGFTKFVTQTEVSHSQHIIKDVIVAHRLLKNSVKESDYLLITRQSLAPGLEVGGDASSFVPGADTYDELGTIEYQYLPLAGYRDEIRVERPARIVLKNPRKVMETSLGINAPLAVVYRHLIDLPGRM